MGPAASRFEIALLYAAGVVQGLALVTFPAASAILVSPTGFALSNTQYGALFVPQVVTAILASALGPRLAQRIGLKHVLLAGLAADVIAMALLAASALLIGSPLSFPVLCVATAALGLGFGAAVMSLNTLVEGFFGERADGAVLTLNALLGLGTALAPVLVALFDGLGAWWALPLLITLLLALLFVALLRMPLALPYERTQRSGGLPARFWIFAAAVFLYGIVETLSGNWATLYLSTERHVSPAEASLALTAFWSMVTLGRVIAALLERFLSAQSIYLGLPILLAGALQFAAFANGAASGIIAFGLVGLASSAILPLSISFAGRAFPDKAATMSGSLIAIYQIGYGVAAFGVGPLREIGHLAFSTVFSAGSFVALALAVVAYVLTRGSAAAE